MGQYSLLHYSFYYADITHFICIHVMVTLKSGVPILLFSNSDKFLGYLL